MKHSGRGFSLIEVMIVVVIIGILAALGYPAYQDQVRKSRRTEARAMLLTVSGMQQRYFTENNIYAASMTALGFNNTNPRFNAGDGSVSSENNWYRVTTTADNSDPANPTFMVIAAPQRDQTNDDCGRLNINQLGVKGWTGDQNLDQCW